MKSLSRLLHEHKFGGRVQKLLLLLLLLLLRYGGSVAEWLALDSGAEGPGSNRSHDAVG